MGVQALELQLAQSCYEHRSVQQHVKSLLNLLHLQVTWDSRKFTEKLRWENSFCFSAQLKDYRIGPSILNVCNMKSILKQCFCFHKLLYFKAWNSPLVKYLIKWQGHSYLNCVCSFNIYLVPSWQAVNWPRSVAGLHSLIFPAISSLILKEDAFCKGLVTSIMLLTIADSLG